MKDLNELVAARDLTERAMNYVERCGFTISVYSNTNEYSELPSDREGMEYYGQGCYIGTFRIAAGAVPDPQEEDGSVGDGPELRLALEAADGVALEAIQSRGIEEDVRETWRESDIDERLRWAAEPLGE